MGKASNCSFQHVEIRHLLTNYFTWNSLKEAMPHRIMHVLLGLPIKVPCLSVLASHSVGDLDVKLIPWN